MAVVETTVSTPALMAILNVSPDSFSGDGGATIAHAHRLIEDGADILDIGGESTRPGAHAVDPKEEQRRVLPLFRALAGTKIPLSIDTRNASTMRAALDAGASIVNDVSGLTHDPASAPLVAERNCRVVIMHSRGTPETMASLAHYADLITEIKQELASRVEAAERAGVSRDNIILDPGIGFAKTPQQNIELLRRLAELRELGFPLLVGVSRKSFIGRYGAAPDPAARAHGSLAAALWALTQGAAIIRVHDVAATRQALRIWQTLSTPPT